MLVVLTLALTAAPDAAEALAARLDELRRERGIPGLAAVVLRGPDTVLARGFGFADVATRTPVTPDTPFDVASVSKPVAGVVALRLAELGKLDLDARMDAFAGFTDFAAAARRSGGVFFGDYAAGPTPLTLRHVLTMRANGDPGTRFWYNPPSFSWASRPMAQAGGRPYSDLVAEHVFRPAGMARSARRNRALPLPAALAADLATPHHRDGQGQVVRSDPPEPRGTGRPAG